MNIKQSVKVMSAKTGKTQKQLAQALNITPQYLSHILMRNRFVKENRLKEMADFFDVPVSEFVRAGE